MLILVSEKWGLNLNIFPTINQFNTLKIKPPIYFCRNNNGYMKHNNAIKYSNLSSTK